MTDTEIRITQITQAAPGHSVVFTVGRTAYSSPVVAWAVIDHLDVEAVFMFEGSMYHKWDRTISDRGEDEWGVEVYPDDEAAAKLASYPAALARNDSRPLFGGDEWDRRHGIVGDDA